MGKKGNLFFVFTPLQLFVAQQIIRQERLDHCVVLWGWYETKFKNVFQMMKIDSLWSAEYILENLGGWAGSSISSLADIQYTRRNYKFIETILKEQNIGTIYLGEILDQSFRFTDIVFRKKGYNIVFFEEGTSHYINRPYEKTRTLKKRFNEFLLDWFYFQPFYGVRFAKWHCTPNRPYDDLPMDVRYSIIPFHNKPFDKRLTIEPMFSKELKEYVESNIPANTDEKRVMLMTDPLRELMEQKDLYLYFDTIKECINSVDDDTTLYIKFHPREIEKSRKIILDIANASGKKYKVLSEEINICVEYYLQKYKFEKIFFFNAATYFYNGYAFPKTEFVKLMPVVYKKAKEAGVGNLVYMENMLKMIEPLALKNNNVQKDDLC